MFKHGKRVLALAAETTPGTAVTPGASSADWQGREVDFKPNVDMERDKVATGDHGENEAVSGEQTIEFTAKWSLKGAATVATAPDWNAVAKANGLRRTVHGSTGQSWIMHTDEEVSTLSAWGLMMEAGATPQQLAMQARGCMGSLKLGCEARAKPVKFESSMKGCWHADADIVTGSRIQINAPSAQTPEKFLSSTVTIHGVTYRVNGWMMDWKAVLAPVPDQSNATGNLHFYLKEWAPELQISIELPRVATDNWRNKLTAMTVGTVVVGIGSNWSLTLPRGQAIARQHKDLDGVEYMDMTFLCLPNRGAVGTMDSAAQVELLNGSKT